MNAKQNETEPSRGEPCNCATCQLRREFEKKMAAMGVSIGGATVFEVKLPRPEKKPEPEGTSEATSKPSMQSGQLALQKKLIDDAREHREKALALESLANIVPGMSRDAVAGVELLYSSVDLI